MVAVVFLISRRRRLRDVGPLVISRTNNNNRLPYRQYGSFRNYRNRYRKLIAKRFLNRIRFIFLSFFFFYRLTREIIVPFNRKQHMYRLFNTYSIFFPEDVYERPFIIVRVPQRKHYTLPARWQYAQICPWCLRCKGRSLRNSTAASTYYAYAVRRRSVMRIRFFPRF